MLFILWLGLKANKKVVGYSHDIKSLLRELAYFAMPVIIVTLRVHRWEIWWAFFFLVIIKFESLWDLIGQKLCKR